MGTPIRPIVIEVLLNEILQERTLLLSWRAIASFSRFGLLPGQYLLGNGFGDLPDTPSIPLTTILEIVVPTLPTLVNAHNSILLMHIQGAYDPILKDQEELQ